MFKTLLPHQVVCNQKDEKGKTCYGHLKKFRPFREEMYEVDDQTLAAIKREFGENRDLVLYRCRLCRTIYKQADLAAISR